MKRLIINADDVGFSDAVNGAARKCLSSGGITGVSVMACGERFKEAAVMLREVGQKEVGVHLTLTAGLHPAADPREVEILLDDDGNFPKSYRELALKYFGGKLKEHHIYKELSSQVKKVAGEGFTVTHIDSHEHVHMFPEVLQTVLAIAVENEVPFVRLPLEGVSIAFKRFFLKDFARHSILKFFTVGKKKQLTRLGLKSSDSFLGHFHAGRLTNDIFYSMLDRLSEGVTELAVHPCERSEGFFRAHPWYSGTAIELDILTDPRLKEYTKENDIHLIPHSAL